MKFNTAVQVEAQKAFAYLVQLTEKQGIVEVRRISPKRTLPQNSYLHLLIGAFGLATGNTMLDAKDLYKWVNRDLYYNKKKIGGQVFTTVRSSADLTKEEMAHSIDRFMEWSKEHGYPLPPATDQEWLRQIENEIEASKHFL
jgi:hypothetical protein